MDVRDPRGGPSDGGAQKESQPPPQPMAPSSVGQPVHQACAWCRRTSFTDLENAPSRPPLDLQNPQPEPYTSEKRTLAKMNSAPPATIEAFRVFRYINTNHVPKQWPLLAKVTWSVSEP